MGKTNEKEIITTLQNKSHNQKKQLKTYQNNVKYYKRKYLREHQALLDIKEYMIKNSRNLVDFECGEFCQLKEYEDILDIVNKALGSDRNG